MQFIITKASIDAKIKEAQDRFNIPDSHRRLNPNHSDYWGKEHWFSHAKLHEWWVKTAHHQDAARSGLANKVGGNPLLTGPGEPLHIVDSQVAKEQQATKLKRAKAVLKTALGVVSKGHLMVLKQPTHKSNQNFMGAYLALEKWVAIWSDRLESEEDRVGACQENQLPPFWPECLHIKFQKISLCKAIFYIFDIRFRKIKICSVIFDLPQIKFSGI